MIILQYNHYCLISEEKIEFFFISPRPLKVFIIQYHLSKMLKLNHKEYIIYTWIYKCLYLQGKICFQDIRSLKKMTK